MEPLKKFKLALILILTIILTGTIGYTLIERWSILDALYMTIITISTVGFTEVRTLTFFGRIFTIFLIITSLSTVAFGISAISSFIIEGEFTHLRRRKKMEKNLTKISDHYIVCGFGQTAKQVIKEFKNAKVPFVIISNQQQEAEKVIKDGGDLVILEADPTDDATLKEARIEKAKGLIAALPTDKDNLFVILSARSLNLNLRIVARAIDEDCFSKMLKAGADYVISPDLIGGKRMASIVLRPEVVNFLDIMTKGAGVENLSQNSRLSGLNLKEARIPQETGLIVVAIKHKEVNRVTQLDSKPLARFTYNPGPQTLLKVGDIIIVLGEDKQINQLKDYIYPVR